MLPLRPPVEPMLARLARELPQGDGLLYEPKWDGFRCLAFVDADGDVVLQSRHGNPLQRYFPEVADAVRDLGPAVLDGELLVTVDGRAHFETLMGRLHPAASRVALLAEQAPACFAAFDLLATSEDLLALPFSRRRRELEQVLSGAPPCVQLTGQTADGSEAEQWLDCPPGSGIDGVVVRSPTAPYEPGRRALLKVKRTRTADLVVAGVRLRAPGEVGTLLLGAYDGGDLRAVGVVANLAKARRAELFAALAPLATGLAGHPWERGFGLEGGALGRFKGTVGRWTPDLPLDWSPVRPERVVEAAYDALDGIRFRHPGRFVRWRPDRDPRSCGVEQLR